MKKMEINSLTLNPAGNLNSFGGSRLKEHIFIECKIQCKALNWMGF